MVNKDISIGSKQDFALHLTFANDPDNGLCATVEESMSWGSIEIWVRGKNLCSHLEGAEVAPSVHWYLLPFIEWLATNWDPLLHEERLPNRNEDIDAWNSLFETQFPPERFREDEEDEWRAQWQRWWSRHNLQSCRSGGLFPDIVIRRYQDMVEVSWGNSRPFGIPEDLVFTYDQGFERLEPKLVAERLYDLLQQAVRYLLSLLSSSQRLHRLEEDIEAIKRAPRDNRVAWLAGLDSFAEAAIAKWQKIAAVLRSAPQDVADYLLETNDDELVIIGSCHAALMFGSASPTLLESDVKQLAHKLIELYATDAENLELRNLVARETINFNDKQTWKTGYNLAERVINGLSLIEQTTDSVNLDAILDRLGIRLEVIELCDNTIRGVSVAGPHHQPSILLNSSDRHNATPEGMNFTIAHELCHILFDRTYAKKLALVSGLWAPLQVEMRAKAFAAMLLMPHELIRRAVARLDGPITTEQAVHDIRARLGTSFKATIEHLQNLEELDPAVADRIEAEREERFSQQGCF
ncbi:MAG: ImmA/IrrE family metallo-endopeptidase [Syntrophobacteraceae bacterium]|nr:ImmA/IrrE family metallo-endopeptidase [Syntrophobacteraceae bacterium]